MPASRSPSRPLLPLLRAGLLVLAALSAGCADHGAAEREGALAEATVKLSEGDPSGALFIAKDAVDRAKLPPEKQDPRLALVAATACLQLERRSEAIEWAERGLAAADVDAELQADLQWARGAGHMGRYRELKEEADWRAASLALEKGAAAGSHRMESAVMLVFLQDLGGHENADKQLKYARLVIELDGGRVGKEVELVRQVLAKKGLTP